MQPGPEPALEPRRPAGSSHAQGVQSVQSAPHPGRRASSPAPSLRCWRPSARGAAACAARGCRPHTGYMCMAWRLESRLSLSLLCCNHGTCRQVQMDTQRAQGSGAGLEKGSGNGGGGGNTLGTVRREGPVSGRCSNSDLLRVNFQGACKLPGAAPLALGVSAKAIRVVWLVQSFGSTLGQCWSA